LPTKSHFFVYNPLFGILSNKLDQKNVTAWLDLRNKAAHGKYTEYQKDQVELMMQGVTQFMARNSI
jgi:hypothetical protein